MSKEEMLIVSIAILALFAFSVLNFILNLLNLKMHKLNHEMWKERLND